MRGISGRIRYCSMALLVAAAFWYSDGHAQILVHFDLPEQPLARSLKAIGTATNTDVGFSASQVAGLIAPAVKADLTVDDALTSVLVGTGLRPRRLDDHTVAITPVAEASTSESGREKSESTKASTPLGQSQVSPLAINVVDHSSSLNLAQVGIDPQTGTTSTNGAENSPDYELNEILVTGSRLRQVSADGALPVQVYSQEQIERSGQGSLNDFLNTLPDVPVAMNTGGYRTAAGAGTVQLHGLPIGTTLVLINGRRVGSSSGQAQFGINMVDLDTIPLVLVERIEIVPAGSSAIYGSDAIAGVVNIILKDKTQGLEASAKYGGASDTNNQTATLSWGGKWPRGSFSVAASYGHQTELQGSDRAITSTGDFARYGGPDSRVPIFCSPGNIFGIDGATLPGLGAATYAAVPTGTTGTATQATFAKTAGTLNTCSPNPYLTRLPDQTQTGLFAHGSYEFGQSTEFFTELMLSHVDQFTAIIPPYLLGLPGFQSYTVPADNPYNPFGTEVGISNLLTGLGRQETRLQSTFVRALGGVRGEVGSSTWSWELATWEARDGSSYLVNNQLNPTAVQAALSSTNPATALNPFVAAPIGSRDLLNSLLGNDTRTDTVGQTFAVSGILRGTAFQLPGGGIQVALGSEFYDNRLSIRDPTNNDGLSSTPTAGVVEFERRSSDIFAEVRVPVIGAANLNGDRLAITAAARYDHDEYFGGETTPQFGVEWRAVKSLLFRGTYSKAFKAPGLTDLFSPITEYPGQIVSDPKKGGTQYAVMELSGGNTTLRPETGKSTTVGFVYRSELVNNLQVSATNWRIDENNSIQALTTQAVIDNENIFPGRVIRNAEGLITTVDTTNLNFGLTQVRGVDYSIDWRAKEAFGELHPSIAVTQTYKYLTALTPGAVPTERAGIANSDLNFAPKWRGTAALEWLRGDYSLKAAGRYDGKYQDYLQLPSGEYQTLGNFWIFDLSLRFSASDALGWAGFANHKAYMELGAVNIFNTLPQYSNNSLGLGYDPTQGDIRGRFVYGQIGIKW